MQLVVEALSSLGQIQLDHLTGARAHKKESADFRAAAQQIGHHTIEFLVGIRHPGQIPFPEDRCAKAGFGKDHHPGSALNQMGAGA